MKEPKKNCCCDKKYPHHGDAIESHTMTDLSPRKDQDFQEHEMRMQALPHPMKKEQKETGRKKHCCHACKCEDAEKKPCEHYAKNCLMWDDKDFVVVHTCKKPYKCKHCTNDSFNGKKGRESVFPSPQKKQHDHKEASKHNWLPGILSTLHKEGMLNLETLFSQELAGKTAESSSFMDAHSSSYPQPKVDMEMLLALFDQLQNDDSIRKHQKPSFYEMLQMKHEHKKGSPCKFEHGSHE